MPSYFPSAPPDVTVAALCLAENAAGALRQATLRVPDLDALVTSLRMREVLRSARQTRYTAMPTETWLAALRLSSPHTDGEDLEEVVRRLPVGRYVRAADLLAAELARAAGPTSPRDETRPLIIPGRRAERIPSPPISVAGTTGPNGPTPTVGQRERAQSFHKIITNVNRPG